MSSSSVSPVFPLEDVAEIASGITLGRKTKETELISVPYLRVANVQDGFLNLKDMKTIEVTQTELERWRLRPGDLLLTEGGDPDKLGRGSVWRGELPLCIHQNHIFRVRLPGDRYDPDYVSAQFGSPYGKTYFLAHGKQTTGIATINRRVLGAFPLRSPPIDEQRRIAERVGSQLRSAETARIAAEAQLREIGLLSKSVLGSSFGNGNWMASFEAAGASPTAQTVAGRPCCPIKMVRLGDIADVQLGKMLSPKSKTGQAPFPYLRNQDVQWGRVNVKDLPTMDFSEQERAKFELCQGDLLVCEGGEPGRCAVWQGEIEPCYFQKALHRIRSRSGQIDMEFLMFWLRHHAWMGTFDHQNAKTTIAHLPRARLLNILVPAISIEDQRAIVDRLKHLLAAAETTRIASYAQLKEIQRLPERILATAFGDGERAA
jgi:type I restriction enzyme S subunit